MSIFASFSPPIVSQETPATGTHCVTLPSSIIGPATEERFPQVERVLVYFEDIQSGRRKLCGEQTWIQFRLTGGEFGEILRRLRGDPNLYGYVRDKIRYDYDDQAQQLIIRMLSDVHETFREALHQELWRWILKLAAREDNVGVFAKGMADTEGAPSYKFPPTIAPRTDRDSDDDAAAEIDSLQAIHTPDIPFRHEEDALPGTIIEVAYFQAQKDLRGLAYTYLVHSNAAVQVVFGSNLKSGSTQSATYSIWRSEDKANTLRMATKVYNQEFRDAGGKPMSHSPLCFRLQDFAMDDTAREILGNEDVELYITMDQLCSFLSKAEAKERDKKRGKLRMKGVHADKRKLPLEETPEPSEEKDEWQQEAARATKRANCGDGAYSNSRKPSVGLTRRKSACLGEAS
ncbi:hypothetical protein GQ44DRAFT_771846 [Phaeosphaeriaceae sp. PMI808]|nr:hypothetical protein GQ44DRAFT_771846 [Phaeosphaeriaceae sp. PMI808]